MTTSSLLRNAGGSSSAEFAMVLPLLLILLFGIIDGARFMWDMNRAEKATQVGVRVAVVTSTLSPGLIDEDYAGTTVGGVQIGPGDPIPANALGTVKCSSGGCSCEAQPCPAALGTMDSAAFNDVLVARMQQIMPEITAANVEVRYSGSGFGSAGSLAGGGGGGGGAPESMEVSPLVTVSLKDMEFRPITSLLFAAIDLPAFSTTMTAEDAAGAFSN
jgi:hypothetical protein